MQLRPRPDDAAVAARVTSLLAGARTGWVPPPLPEEGADDGAVLLEPDGRPAGDLGAHAGGAAETPGHGSVEPGGGGADAAASRRGAHARPAPERSWSPRVPATLAGGRLDPGRRGVWALVLLAVVAALAAGGVALRGRPQEVRLPEVQLAGEPLPGVVTEAETADDAELVVAVEGDVVAPGVVRLPPGSRVDDAVRAAGGLVPGGSYGLLNLARKLVDGEQVLVGIDPPPGHAAAPGGAPAAGALLDLNLATLSDLDALPGVGPVLAQRILDWRTQHDGFASVDQLREVTGIGESRYADLKDKVTVG